MLELMTLHWRISGRGCDSHHLHQKDTKVSNETYLRLQRITLPIAGLLLLVGTVGLVSF